MRGVGGGRGHKRGETDKKTSTITSKEMQQCTTALNNAIRRIFTFHRWESVRSLREAFHYKSIVEIFSDMSRKFMISLSSSNPS